MYEQTLQNIGLDEKEAAVYEELLRLGPSTMPKLLTNTPFKRGDLYNILNDLEEWGLVEPEEKDGKKWYNPAHPSKLEDLLKDQEKELKQMHTSLQGVLPDMLSQYRLFSGKPGVRYFEGRDGVAEVLNDSLTAHESIYTYADIEAIVKYIDDVNSKYVNRREKLNLQKKAIIADSDFSRDYLKGYHRDVTDIRLIGEGVAPFHNVMQIYDNKVSYLTLDEKNISGIIIQDPAIYHMHRALFEFTWKHLLPLEAPTAKHAPKTKEPPHHEGPIAVFKQ